MISEQKARDIIRGSSILGDVFAAFYNSLLLQGVSESKATYFTEVYMKTILKPSSLSERNIRSGRLQV